jgi:putative hemolysin
MPQHVFQQLATRWMYGAPQVKTPEAPPSWLSSILNAQTDYSQLNSNAPILGSMNSMQTRLARSRIEISKAQSLRYEVFHKELSAKSNVMALLTRRDQDSFDNICDHLLVLDQNAKGASEIVATYRLLRQEVSEQFGKFYSSSEFDLEPLLARFPHLDFLELGRSCILPAWRNKRTIELLWQGAWAYILQHDVDVMIGCASLQGTDPVKLALPLSYLHHHARAPEGWRVGAAAGRGVKPALLKADEIDSEKALRSLPPLIKGYLRLGAWVSEEAVVDHQFGTTDILIVLPIANIKQRYLNYYNAKVLAHKSGV